MDDRGQQPTGDEPAAGTEGETSALPAAHDGAVTSGSVALTKPDAAVGDAVFSDAELAAAIDDPDNDEEDDDEEDDDREGKLPRSASLSPSERVIPTWTDPTVRRASEVIGGPLGRHAIVGRAAWLTPLRVCLLMAIMILIFGWLFKSACIQQGPNGAGGVTLDQSGERPWITGCYNDVVPLYGSHKLDTQSLPYKTSWVGQRDGALHGVPGRHRLLHVGHVRTGQVLRQVRRQRRTAGATGRRRLLHHRRDHPRRLLPLGGGCDGADSPATGVGRRHHVSVPAADRARLHELGPAGHRHDGGARWWPGPEGGPVLAGALIGLGTATKLYPVLLLGPILLLCFRSGKYNSFVRATVSAAVVWLVINVPIMALYPAGWYEFIKLNSQRPAEYDSWYAIYTTLSGSHVFDNAVGADSPKLLNALSLVLFGLSCLAIAWFALSSQRRPRLAQLIFLVVAAFLLTNKVWSPQYSLWLLPLVVLALPRWRPVLAWQFSEVVVWMLLMFSFAGVDNKGLSIYPFVGAAILRDILLLVLVVRVIREIQRPADDLVRMAGDDDPSGGIFENAPDVFVLPSIVQLWKDRKAPPEPVAGELVAVGASGPDADDDPDPDAPGLVEAYPDHR